MKVRALLIPVAFLLALVIPAPAAAAPQLGTVSYWAPTHLQPGAEASLWVQFRNTGPDPTSGSWTLRVTLPPGVTYAGLAQGSWESPSAWGGWCAGAAAGETTIVCPSTAVLPRYSANTGFGTGDPNWDPISHVGFKLSVSPGAAGSGPLRIRVSGGGSATSTEEHTVAFSSAPTPFGLFDQAAETLDTSGAPFTQAGGHPRFFRTFFRTTLERLFGGDVGKANVVGAGGAPRTLHVLTPPGFVGNPLATPRCPQRQFLAFDVDDVGLCPHESQVGFAIINVPIIGLVKAAIYNLEPPPHLPAQFGFATPAGPVTLNPTVNSDGRYELQTTVSSISQADTLLASEVVLWGEPSSPLNDEQRCRGLNTAARACVGKSENNLSAPLQVPHPFEGPRKPFLSLPTNCTEAQTTSFLVDRWEDPAPDGNLGDPRWEEFQASAPAPTGCEALDFAPTLEARPSTNLADSPSGLDVHLRVPQSEDPEGVATAHLEDAVVTLPEGMTLNPAGANGLASCSAAQIGLLTAPGAVPPSFDENDPSCPAASKVADATVTTPLLADPLSGEVFLAAQRQNPFGTDFALYIVVRGPGILIKLAGEVRPDPATGRLQTIFSQNPQLPFSDLELDVFGGARAPLATPPSCGSYTTASQLTPWSAPFTGPAAAPSDSWAISAGPDGGACASSPAQLPFAPQLDAGTVSPLAGIHSPFVLRLRRGDGQQDFRSLDVTLPPGLSGRVAGIAACPEANLAKFAGRVNTPPGTAAEEIASPSCPASSRVGSVVVGAGAGPSPLYVNGDAYLAGPYKGAPLSLVAIVPAKAGPFDLGAVMVRNAIRLDPRTAQITVESDELPTIVQGIPVKVRDLRVVMDRPGFTLNPTSCEAKQIQARVGSSGGGTVQLGNRFQVGECGALGFKPKLDLRLFGDPRRGSYQRLRATLTARRGDANIARASVTMPKAAFLAQEHLNNICTRVQFAADACPKGSVYGKATAISPLVDYPLSGNVYLRSSDNKLPDLVADLRGPAHQPIRVELVGRTDSHRRALRNTFDVVPDAPVSKFTLELLGGKHSLIVLSRNICGGHRATVDLTAQNGRRSKTQPLVRNPRCKQGRSAKKRRGARGR